jgi:hypothetical protein
MFPNLFKAYIEGLGSKRLGAALAGVVAVFLAPVAQKYLGLPSEELLPVLVGISTMVIGFLFTQWHLDTKTGGATTTAHRLTLALAQAGERAIPDGTTADAVAKAVVAALQAGALEPPPAEVPPTAVP